MNIENNVKNWQAVERWPEVVGSRISQHAKACGVDADSLLVEVDNPVWQSQLFIMKARIIEKYKKYNVYFKDIKFMIAK